MKKSGILTIIILQIITLTLVGLLHVQYTDSQAQYESSMKIYKIESEKYSKYLADYIEEKANYDKDMIEYKKIMADYRKDKERYDTEMKRYKESSE